MVYLVLSGRCQNGPDGTHRNCAVDIEQDSATMADVDREFCPPSQLRRGMIGLQFKPVRAPQNKTRSPTNSTDLPKVLLSDSRRSSADSSSVTSSHRSSLVEREPSEYEHLPLENDRPRAPMPKHEKCPSWPEPRHNAEKSKGWPKSSGAPATERSQSWVWNERDLRQSASNCASSSKKPSQDSGIGDDQSSQVFGARQPHLTSDPCKSDWFGSDNSQLLIVSPDSSSDRNASSPSKDSASSCSDESPRAPEAPKMNDPLNYDSETLRRSAQKNREVSRKLFLQMQMRSPGSGTRTVMKSPSQLSSSATSSCGSSASSGIGTLRSSIYAPTSEQEEPLSRTLLCRSQSSDNFLRPPPPAGHSPTVWNTPQQRRNILSMVEIDADSSQNTQCPSEIMSRERSLLYAEHCHGLIRTASSAAANRGVSKKISSKRRAAREAEEQQRSLLRSMPELSQTSTPTTAVASLDTGFQTYNGSSDYLSLTACESTANRSISPIYAVPDKPTKFDLRATQSTNQESAMKSPPPLPRKPPPPLDQLNGAQDRLGSLNNNNKCVSSPSLIESCKMSARNVTSYAQINVGDQQSSNVAPVWPRTQDQTPSSSAEPHSSPYGSVSAGGKPTVQVHPFVPTSESRQTLSISVPGERKSKSPNPRPPPVPKKPDYLMSPPKPKVRLSKQETSEHRQKLDSVEQTCNRLSKLVSENDKSLETILNTRPPVSSKVVKDFDVLLENTSGTASVSRCSSFAAKPSDISPTSERVLKGLYGKGASCSSSVLVQWTNSDSNMDMQDLEIKKRELIQSLSRKLTILEEVQQNLSDDMELNDKLGQSISQSLEQSGASDHQMHKFRLHVEDTEKITCLLLKLHAQLGRVKNALQGLSADASPKEKKMLKDRHQRLTGQLDDAKTLRNNLNKRGDAVLCCIEQLLPPEMLADYKHFLHEKTSLLAEAREIEEKLSLGRDQLGALELSLCGVEDDDCS